LRSKAEMVTVHNVFEMDVTVLEMEKTFDCLSALPHQSASEFGRRDASAFLVKLRFLNSPSLSSHKIDFTASIVQSLSVPNTKMAWQFGKFSLPSSFIRSVRSQIVRSHSAILPSLQVIPGPASYRGKLQIPRRQKPRSLQK
jgi:hypothetical protein